MSVIAGMARVYDAQRTNTTRLEDEEGNLRRLAEMRANDEQANYNKGMDRSLQATRANRTVTPGALPGAQPIPSWGVGQGAPAAPRSGPTQHPLIQRSQVKPNLQPQPTENQSSAESARLARVPLPVERDNQGRPLSATFPGRQLAESATARGRLDELRALNPPVAQPDQSNAETARLSRGAAPEAQGPLDGPIEFDDLAHAVYGQESNYGRDPRANTINSSGAVGPMQVTADTFEGLKRNGVIPAHYEHTNPQHNMEAGRALLRTDLDRFGGDPRKALAAYYSGPKAVNADGTIRDLRDPRNPNAPTTLQYVDQVLARVGRSAPAQPSTATPGVAPASSAAPAASAAPVTIPPVIPRDMFMRVSQGAMQREQMLTLRNQQLQEELRFTRDPDKQLTLISQMEAAAVDIYETRLVRAAAAAGSGDMGAMSQLAQEAGVSVAQGPNGTIVIVSPQADGSGRPTATLAPGQAASQLYELISPRLQAARAAAATKIAEQGAQASREIGVERVKGEEARRTEMVRAEGALQRVIAEGRSKGSDVKQVVAPDIGRNAVVSIDGRMFEVIPGAEVDGMMTETTLKPVRQ